jgi:hypothetical protein
MACVDLVATGRSIEMPWADVRQLSVVLLIAET